LQYLPEDPIASAILGATAKQLVDSVATHLKGEKVEVRLFGPDRTLIRRHKIEYPIRAGHCETELASFRVRTTYEWGDNVGEVKQS
jgi:hypothetical protein